MKTCRVCGVQHPLEEFPPQPQLVDGRDTRCYVCLRSYNRKRYNSSEKVRQSKYQHTKNARDRNRRYVWDYLEDHPCIDCGESNPVVLDFDHRDRTLKTFGIADRGTVSLEILATEISKCDVRCKNCHTKRTAVQLGWYSWRAKDTVEKGSEVDGI